MTGSTVRIREMRLREMTNAPGTVRPAQPSGGSVTQRTGRVIQALVYFAVVFALLAMAAGVFAPFVVPGR